MHKDGHSTLDFIDEYVKPPTVPSKNVVSESTEQDFEVEQLLEQAFGRDSSEERASLEEATGKDADIDRALKIVSETGGPSEATEKRKLQKEKLEALAKQRKDSSEFSKEKEIRTKRGRDSQKRKDPIIDVEKEERRQEKIRDHFI